MESGGWGCGEVTPNQQCIHDAVLLWRDGYSPEAELNKHCYFEFTKVDWLVVVFFNLQRD